MYELDIYVAIKEYLFSIFCIIHPFVAFMSLHFISFVFFAIKSQEYIYIFGFASLFHWKILQNV